jgi:hypothetical protein
VASHADEDTSVTDLEEIRKDYFDVRKTMGRNALGQTARALQDAMKLNKAPSIELLQSMRDWQHQMRLPLRTYPEWSGFMESVGRWSSPQPTQSDMAADAKSDESVKDIEDSLFDTIMAPNIL